MKKCKKCCETKPLNEFVRNKKCKDGYENTCKICRKKRKKETDKLHYMKNIQTIKKCECCGKDYKSNKTRESKLCNSCNRKGKLNHRYGISRDKHWNWNNNITDEERVTKRNYIEYNHFRDNVYERDNYTCQITGQRGKDLVVHHLSSYSKNEELRLDIDNGVTLLKSIHKLFHDLYGYKNFTQDDYFEFKKRYENGEFI